MLTFNVSLRYLFLVLKLFEWWIVTHSNNLVFIFFFQHNLCFHARFFLLENNLHKYCFVINCDYFVFFIFIYNLWFDMHLCDIISLGIYINDRGRKEIRKMDIDFNFFDMLWMTKRRMVSKTLENWYVNLRYFFSWNLLLCNT